MTNTKLQGFVRNVGLIAGGTAGAQVVLVLASPILTRLYDPADFGLMAVCSGLLLVLSSISAFRYELAIPLHRSDRVAGVVLALCLLCITASCVILSAAILGFRAEISVLLGIEEFSHYLWFVPAGVFVYGIYNSLNLWALRGKKFALVSQTKMSQSLSVVLLQFTAFKLGAAGLLLGQLIGYAVGVFQLWWRNTPSFNAVSPPRLKGVACRYKRFPAYSTGDALFNSASHHVPPILLAFFFGAASAGLYALALRVVSLPLTVVGAAVGQVFFSTAASVNRSGQLETAVATIYQILARFMMPVSVLLILFSPALFELIFGEKWRGAGELVQWMAPWLFFSFVSSPLSTVFVVKGWQRRLLLFQVALFVARMTALVASAQFGDFLFTIKCFSFASACCYLFLLVWIHKSIAVQVRGFVKVTAKIVATAVFCATPVLLCSIFPQWVPDIAVEPLYVLSAVFFVVYYFFLARQCIRLNKLSI